MKVNEINKAYTSMQIGFYKGKNVVFYNPEYETRDMFPDSSKPQVNYWTASLRITYRGKTVKSGERLKNPVGFTVDRYSLTYNKVQ